ncbi:hypothetical protein [Actinacidiphila yeochonensis]|uniref:hypothetical protein n=1 Tax=Actinacidiphila yeochonensis TaxID=89050 RepID=UPI000A69B265|nr:hypothetical protein [Actinacidiphila yeochonensis]
MGRWWWAALLRRPQAGPAGSRGRLRAGPMAKERQELVLREWAALLEQLRRVATARVADAGDALRAGELAPPPGSHAERDYLWALEAYEAAGRLLDDAADLPDLAAAVVLAERAVERLEAAHARLAGQRPPAAKRRCSYNPLHAPARREQKQDGRRGRRARFGPREAAAERWPACESCHRDLLAGRPPDVLPALVRVRVSRRRTAPVLVPYLAVPRQFSPWAASACGAYGDAVPGFVLRGGHRREARP